MLLAVNSQALTLHRESFGGVTIGDLREGDWRQLEEDELVSCLGWGDEQRARWQEGKDKKQEGGRRGGGGGEGGAARRLGRGRAGSGGGGRGSRRVKRRYS